MDNSQVIDLIPKKTKCVRVLVVWAAVSKYELCVWVPLSTLRVYQFIEVSEHKLKCDSI